MSTIKWLGIYPEAIENEQEKCHDMLEEFEDVFNELNISNHLREDSNELEDVALERLSEIIEYYDMTNSIISALHEATFICLEGVEDGRALQEFDISFESYVNCNDSHLNIMINGNSYEYPNESIEDIFKEALLEKEQGFYQGYAEDQYIMGEIAEFWQTASFKEVADFYTDGIIPDGLKSYIDASAKVYDLEDSIPKDLIHRFCSNEVFADNLTKTIYDALPEYCEGKCVTANELYHENALYLECLKDVMNYDADIKNKYCVKNGKITEERKNVDLAKD